MRAVPLISTVLLLTALPCLSVANPDGPVGSVILEPRFVRDDQSAGSSWTDQEVGAAIIVPVHRFLTLSVGASQVKVQGNFVLDSAGGAGPARSVNGGSLTVGDHQQTNFSVSARVYIPITRSARDRLKQ